MEITQKFKDIAKPVDIDPEELSKYLEAFYGEARSDVNNPAYVDYPSKDEAFKANWVNFPYKKQADLLIDKLKQLSKLDKFEEIRSVFARPIDKGSSRDDAELVRISAEAICFNLENDKNIDLNRFADEIKSATLNECKAGAGTNMQKILYAMKPSEYYQKYDFIQNLANEYLIEHKLSRNVILDVHVANELIHEASRAYNVTPPNDTHARYRNLSNQPNEDFQKHHEFLGYLNRFLGSRAGVYSFVSSIANATTSRLPDEKDLKITDDAPIGEDTSSKAIAKIDEILKGSKIEPLQILTENAGGEYIYKHDYQDIILLIEMKRFLDAQLVEAEPLKINEKAVIEAPSGWYLLNEGKYKKLLDTKEFCNLTINKQNIEDYLHDALKEPLTANIGFDNALRAVVEDRQSDIIKDIILSSDQAKNIVEKFTPDEISAMPIAQIQQWIKYLEIEKPEAAIAYVAEHGDGKMLNKCFELLKKTNTNIDLTNWQDDSGNSLLHIATKNTNIEVFQYLIEKKLLDINRQNLKRETPLHAAIYYNRPDALKALIEAGADQTIQNKYGYTPLHFAIAYNKPDAIKALIEAKADLNIQKNGYTPLHSAIMHNKPDALKALIEARADQTIQDKDGYPPLHFAILNGKPDAIKALIEAKADLNIQNKYGYTPLHSAIISYKPNAIKALIEAKADLNIKVPNDFDLKKAVIDVFKEAILAEDAQTINNLLKHNAKLKEEYINPAGGTLLSYAVDNDKTNIAAYMIKQGFQPQRSWTDLINQMNAFHPEKTPSEIAKSIGGKTLFNYKVREETLKKIMDIKTSDTPISIHSQNKKPSGHSR